MGAVLDQDRQLQFLQGHRPGAQLLHVVLQTRPAQLYRGDRFQQPEQEVELLGVQRLLHQRLRLVGVEEPFGVDELAREALGSQPVRQKGAGLIEEERDARLIGGAQLVSMGDGLIEQQSALRIEAKLAYPPTDFLEKNGANMRRRSSQGSPLRVSTLSPVSPFIMQPVRVSLS